MNWRESHARARDGLVYNRNVIVDCELVVGEFVNISETIILASAQDSRGR